MTLYRSLLGPAAWERLAPELHEFHGRLPTTLEGRLEISGGGGPLGHLLRRLAGMPTSRGEMDGRLDVRASEDREVWHRSFGRWCWRSVQWWEDGCLVEQTGPWRFRFRLRVDEGRLHLDPAGVGLCLGRLCLPLPNMLVPTIVAREQAVAGTGEVEVRVEVRAGGWKILTYGGRLRKVNP